MSLKYTDSARKILCIGRNYVAHIKELNNLQPQQPFFFLKPSSSILKPNEGPVLIPSGAVVHYEVELAFVLGQDLKNLPASFSNEEALAAIDGYALAVDMSARNVQDEAKKKGLPWSIAKGFDTFLPLSGLVPKEKIPDPYNVELTLAINGEVRQNDKTDLMIFPIHKILSHMSSIMTLQKGDIILTGTPAGVGKIVPGDRLTASLKYNSQILEQLDLVAEQKPGPYEYKET